MRHRLTPKSLFRTIKESFTMMWALVHAVFFGMVCGIVASRRDRSVLAWAFLGALFGIFAAAALACLEIPRKSAHLPPQTDGTSYQAPPKGVHMVRQGDRLVPVSELAEKPAVDA